MQLILGPQKSRFLCHLPLSFGVGVSGQHGCTGTTLSLCCSALTVSSGQPSDWDDTVAPPLDVGIVKAGYRNSLQIRLVKSKNVHGAFGWLNQGTRLTGADLIRYCCCRLPEPSPGVPLVQSAESADQLV